MVNEIYVISMLYAQPPRDVPLLAIDPGIRLNMVNVKPPYLVDLEIESMKNLFLECNR